MAKRKLELNETEVVKRNVTLHSAFMRYILDHPDVLDKLPSDFRLVILPENDPALRAYNLELLDKNPAKNKPVIFIRMKVSKKMDFDKQRLTVYLPLAA